MKQRHAELIHRVKYSVKPADKALWLNEAARVRRTQLLVVVTRSCDWFSNRVKELRNEA